MTHAFESLTPDTVLDALESVGLRGDGRLQQIGMEWQHLDAVTRGALWKHRQHIAGLQPLGHVMHHAQRVAR